MPQRRCIFINQPSTTNYTFTPGPSYGELGGLVMLEKNEKGIGEERGKGIRHLQRIRPTGFWLCAFRTTDSCTGFHYKGEVLDMFETQSGVFFLLLSSNHDINIGIRFIHTPEDI